MTIFDAFAGGVHSMFSVWLSCLLQIVPFFIAFAVGASLLGEPEAPFKNRLPTLFLAIILPFLGFVMVFASLGMTTTAMSKTIFKALGPANDFGGVTIALVALYFIGLINLNKVGATAFAIKACAALFFGMALAFAYKPCVTPTLTKIYSVSSVAQTSTAGGVLLSFYSLGFFVVIATYATALSWAASKAPGFTSIIKKGCAALLLVISFLILSGNMTHYKSFLVGGFVTHDMSDHSGGATDNKEKKMDHSHGDMK